MARYNIICVHTMVGYLWGTEGEFKRDGYYGVESHFGVGGPADGTDDDGRVVQWQDTAFQADANYDGKPEVLSIETSDGAKPDTPWSPNQLTAIVRLIAWLCRTHNIPAHLINGNLPGTRGIAYHRQGCDHGISYRPRGWPYDQWRVPGGVKWSTSLGKVCPGDVRIRQLVDVVIPRVQQELKPKEDVMTPAQEAKLDAALAGARDLAAAVSAIARRVENIEKGSVRAEREADSGGIYHDVARIEGKVDALAASVSDTIRKALAEGVVAVDVTVANKTEA